MALQLVKGEDANYLATELVGNGGYGTILRGHRLPQDGVDVAIKYHGQMESITDELLMLKRVQEVDCLFVVKLIDVGMVMDQECLVMEWLQETLLHFTETNREGIDNIFYLRIIHQSTSALSALKKIGIVHADIKPDNWMLVPGACPVHIKLIDFGMAMHVQEEIEVTPEDLGIISFRSPEALIGLPLTYAVDMWALGITLSYIIVGSLPFKAKTNEGLCAWIDKDLGFSKQTLDKGTRTLEYYTINTSGNYKLRTKEKIKKSGVMMKLQSYTGKDEYLVQLIMSFLQVDPQNRCDPSTLAEDCRLNQILETSNAV